jgi:hypothetical protein
MTAPRTLTGNLTDLKAAPAGGVRLSFSRAGGVVSQYGDVVLPNPVNTVTNSSGAFSLTLYPGTYTGRARVTNGSLTFRFSLGETGPTDLASILEEAEIAVTPQIVIDAREILEDTEDARDAAIAAVATVPLSQEDFSTVAALLADTALTYTAAQPKTVTVGQIVPAGGFRYQVAASSATDHHVTTAGGVKLYVLPGADGGISIKAFGDTSVLGIQTLFKTAADAAIALDATLDITSGTYAFTAAVALGAGTLRLRVRSGAEIVGTSPSGHDLFQLTGTSLIIEDRGGLWHNFRYFFSWEATADEIHPTFVLDGSRAMFRDYARWINLPNGHNTASDIWVSLRGFDLLPRYTASTATSFDVLQFDTSSLKIKKWTQTDYTAFGGQRFHCRWLLPNNESIFVSNFDVREYTNNSTGGDADAQFFFPRALYVSITDGYLQGLRIGNTSVNPSDTEGIRGGGENLFIDNLVMVDAGAAEATLSLKGCGRAKVGKLRVEYTDEYKAQVLAAAGSVKRLQPFLLPLESLEIDSLTVVNCNASVFDVVGSAVTPRVDVKLLTMIDCLLDTAASPSAQGVIRYDGAGSFFRIERLDILTTPGNDSKIPVSLVRNLRAGTVIVESGNMRFSGAVIAMTGTSTIDLIDVSGDITLGADSSDTRIVAHTSTVTANEMRLNLRVLNGGARLSPVQLFSQPAMQAIKRARVNLDWRFNSEVVDNIRFLFLYAPDNSLSRLRLKGQIWDHDAGDGADLEQEIWWKTTPTATVASLGTAINTVRQTGSTFTAPSSPLSSGGLQLRLCETDTDHVCSGAALIQYEHERVA